MEHTLCFAIIIVKIVAKTSEVDIGHAQILSCVEPMQAALWHDKLNKAGRIGSVLSHDFVSPF